MDAEIEDVDQPCPYCGETVKFFDAKCSHCGERLREKAGPEWKDKVVVVPDMGQILTDDCTRCGAKNAPPLAREFTYVPGWVTLVSAVLLPIYCLGLFVGLVLYLMLRKTGTVTFRFCRSCRVKWVLADLGVSAFVVFGLIALPFLGYVIDDAFLNLSPQGGWAGAWIGVLLYLPLAPIATLVVRRRYEVRCVAVEPHVEVSLRFPRPELLRKLIDARRARRKR